jgi:hypothetical protein
MAESADGTGVQLAELLAVLSLAADLGMGQPMEHVLRQSLIALRLAQRLGLDDGDREVVYYASLVAWVGCHVDAYEQAKWFGDDTVLKHDFRRADFTSAVDRPLFILRHLGADRRLGERARLGVTFLGDGRRAAEAMLANHWQAADALAAQLGMSQRVRDSVEQTFERWGRQGRAERRRRRGHPAHLAADHARRRGGGVPSRGRHRSGSRGSQEAARNPVRPAGGGRVHRGPGVRRGARGDR